MSAASIQPAVSSVKIREHALRQRVNRFLAKRGEKLHKSRGYRKSQVGAWYVVNTETRQITGCFINLRHVAEVLGLLQPWEEID